MKFEVTREWLERKLDEMRATGTDEPCVVDLPVQPAVATHPLGGVRAKMKCNTTEQAQYEHGFTSRKVKLGAVYSQTGENADFSKATPSGECWMNIDPDVPAAEFFKPGKSYYVTFTEAPDK